MEVWKYLLAGLVAVLGTIPGSRAWADSSDRVLEARSEPEQTIEGATSITVIVDGMMKSRSGAT